MCVSSKICMMFRVCVCENKNYKAETKVYCVNPHIRWKQSVIIISPHLCLLYLFELSLNYYVSFSQVR